MGSRPEPGPADAGIGAVGAVGAAALGVEIVIDDGDWSAFGTVEPLVEAATAVVSRRLWRRPRAGVAVVALSCDAEMRRLNHTFRGKDAPTNVLSFPVPAAGPSQPDPTSAIMLGDIVLGAETVLAECRDTGTLPAHHLQHLVVHGLLHLLGYDHDEDADAERMERLETSLLAELGIADPYAVPPHHGTDAAIGSGGEERQQP